MKKMFLMAAVAAVMVVGSQIEAAELPSFEMKGLPITRHQVAVMGAQNVKQESATPTLMYGGMPASPHQVAVLMPRPSMTAKATAVKLTTVGLSER
ncbi:MULTISPECIES: hypothetical protein [Bradyrhizobium]|uniref:hypothetical protein n=1 Tax=Bradyrhizobium TaxID=374 RepID=UPI00155E6CAB|nr:MULTISPECIES: hypothetical protein [Bradyrhizobium]MDD1522229.1 hypothetical protein [Bradyrhizobium sp. WBAH30]MDD1546283.1 hypothetical protein [Bradyrhizobium sp. WBAH41]MDD1559736.1 hypothetical protein [Bradyrhizobium sp. WBAH23]MDD1567578.1 hypothetical protein [Bradyrhizobium sp. WBAH33]MDD1593146.1 hypothetical protein [Bradyrhizobium sp. WBAH42]